ncbi:MAG: penicillin acylase family protein, partial [Janthinobacterium lividum]
GFEWADPYRAERIHAVLAGDASHTLAASQALQTDVFSAPALRLAAMAPDGTFRGWDGHLRADSPEAALCEAWWARHLRPALLAVLVPDDLARGRMLPGDTNALLDALDHPGPAFGSDPEAARDRMLRDTWATTQADCAQRMGPDRSAWRWGALHHACFTHALSRLAGHAEWDTGPAPIGGSAATPMAAGYRASDFRLLAGASVRMVVDVGDWDRSVCINTPGQSGDPRSPHYADLMGPWSRGEYVPMLYTDAAIRDAAEDVLTLHPC